ncbi:MAG: transglycosylase SLT domain-containing protein [Geminicoccaceae bacterium]
MLKGLAPIARLIFALTALAVSGLPSVEAATSSTCREIAARIEQKENLPKGLLYSIALTESGRWDPNRKQSYAWPWTVRASEDSFVATTSDGALSIVRKLQEQGRRNIDVGCMQVNLFYHGDHFTSLEQAIDPVDNMLYAARFLKELRQQNGTWARAIERYHSSDPVRGRDYRKRVTDNWNSVKGQNPIVRASFEDHSGTKRSAHGSLHTETRFFERTGLSIDIIRPVDGDRIAGARKERDATGSVPTRRCHRPSGQYRVIARSRHAIARIFATEDLSPGFLSTSPA